MTTNAIAQTGQGRLRGARDGQALRFLGIPYAESPAAAGRFAAPKALAADMHGALVRFVADGDPGWERHAAGRWPVMVFAEPSGVAEDPLEMERAAWT